MNYANLDETMSSLASRPARSQRRAKTKQPGAPSSKLALLGSTAMLALSLPLATPEAHAQAVPIECEPNPAVDGATVTCLAPAPVEVGEILTTSDNLTIVIGEAETPTAVNGAFLDQNGITMSGGGDLSITVTPGSSVTGFLNGIRVGAEFLAGEDVTIDSLGTIFGQEENGILVVNSGFGQTSIVASDVSGGENGILVNNNTGATDVNIDTTAGSVVGGTNGIEVSHSSTGATNIVTGDVTGTAETGITVETILSATDIAINTTAGSVFGGTNGVEIDHDGNGALTVATGEVVGETFYGILAITGANTTEATIDTTGGAVTGDRSGLEIFHGGTGTLSIATADVSGLGAEGISIATSANAARVMVDSTAGTVFGQQVGIGVSNAGSGISTIETSDVVSATGVGILAESTGSAGTLFIDTTLGQVEALQDAIRANNGGVGNLLIVTGSVASTIDDGIDAQNGATANSLTIDATSGSVLGGDMGIFANNEGAGAISITTADVTGEGSTGLFANNDTGTDVSVDTTDGTVVGAVDGIRVLNAGTGTTSVRTADVTGTLGEGIIVEDDTGTGDLTIDSSQGAVSGGRFGIIGTNLGSGVLSITTADVSSAEFDAINALNVGGGTSDLLINTVAGGVVGERRGIFADNTGSGDTIVTTADVTGHTTAALRVLNTPMGANMTIDTSAGSVVGQADGIFAENVGTGALSITTADVTGVDQEGIEARNGINATDLTINSIAGTVSGGDIGLFAANQGTGSMLVTTADVSGALGSGVFIGNDATGVDVTVDSSAGSVMGATNGVEVVNFGSGTVSVTTGDVFGVTSNGIRVADSTSGGSVVINSLEGSVTGGEDGIEVDSAGDTSLSITTADVTGETLDGIDVATFAQTIDIDTSAGAVSGAFHGLDIRNFGDGALSIIAGDVSGGTGRGVFAQNLVGSTEVSVNTSAGSVSAGGIGIVAFNRGSGSASITTGDVTSVGTDGVLVDNGMASGDVFVDTSAGTVTGLTNAVRVEQASQGLVDITVDQIIGGATGVLVNTTSGATVINLTSTAFVEGQSDAAIAINSVGGSATVQGSSGVIEGASDGIFIETMGGDILIQELDSVTGNGGNGIEALSGGGAIDIDAVDTALGLFGNGIDAQSDGGDISVQGSGLVGGIVGEGVAGVSADARNAGGGLGGNVNIGGINPIGDASGFNIGVFAVTDGEGSITIDTSAGAVSGSNNGILAASDGSGDVTITLSDATSVVDDAVRASSVSGDVAVSVLQGATVIGGDSALRTETTNANAVINNAGELTGANFAISGFDNGVGTATVNNVGVINGSVSFENVASSFNNSGLFNATANSLFGSQEDSFNNNGLLTVDGDVIWGGLEITNNSGRISFTDGEANDELTLAGDYVGLGGTLEIEVSLAEDPVSDLLTITGAATGSTVVDVASLTPSAQIGASVVIIDAEVGTSEDAFSLADGNVQQLGFLSVGLRFDASENDFLLESALGQAAFQITKIGEGAQSVWYRSADAWASHVDSKRHKGSQEQVPLWVQLYGVTSERDDSFSFTSGGFSQAIELDYGQDFFGLQGGVELEDAGDGERIFYGLTGGYVSSTLGFEGLADAVNYSGLNLGAYLGYQGAGFFANGLVKYDFIDADIQNQSVGYDADISADAYGTRVEAGYRWMSQGGFFLEPSVSAEYQKTSLDGFDALGASFSFDGFDGLRGQAGLRLGGETDINSGSKLTYYTGAYAVHEFAGDGDVTVALPLASATIANRPIDTFGRFDLGLAIVTQKGVTGFIEGQSDFSSNYTRFGGRAGLRIAF